MPGAKRRFATSTKATSDLIELIAEYNLSVTESVKRIIFDNEARDILRAFEAKGYGEHRLSDVLRNNV